MILSKEVQLIDFDWPENVDKLSIHFDFTRVDWPAGVKALDVIDFAHVMIC